MLHSRIGIGTGKSWPEQWATAVGSSPRGTDAVTLAFTFGASHHSHTTNIRDSYIGKCP